jgi:hypothetical protein
MTNLADLANEARGTGWAVGSMPLLRLRWQASDLGWREVATRKGDATVSVLRPTSAEAAPPRSLSATHGLAEQPLHTDGAHLKEPPQFVVLYAAQPNNTPTLLWSIWSKVTNPVYPNVTQPSYLNGGLFMVRSGNERFLASAHDGSLGYRYDPGCMTPCDERARQAVLYFESLSASAYRHEWTEPHQVLVIRNRRVLHARAAVAEADAERELTRIAYRVEKKP